MSVEREVAQGRAMAAQGRLDEAAGCFGRAVAAAPDQPEGWVALAECLLAGRRLERCLSVCGEALRRFPRHPDLLVAKARALQSLSRVAEAADLFARAAALAPGHAGARFGLALQAVEDGRWSDAQASLAPLLAAHDVSPDARWLAARIALGTGRPHDALPLAQAVAAITGLRPDQRAEALLLAGEALDRLDRPARAFIAFSQGKALLRTFFAGRAAGRESEIGRLQRLTAWFRACAAPLWLSSPGEEGEAGVTGHAFLIGFPRSGTTLLEQALAGHSRIASLEEAPTLAEASAHFLADEGGLDRLAVLGAEEAAHWRRVYWSEVRRAGVDPRGRLFLDKAPAASALLPLIAKLFPRARILLAVRDPRDVTLSCFRHSFQMNALTYAFTDIEQTAHCYAATMTLLDTCRTILTLPVLEVRHERLLEDFPGGLARICGFLGVGFEPSMTEVAAVSAARTIRTPSAAQVRGGLTTAGVARWRAYARELEPVMPILAPWTKRFGYD